MLVAVANGQAVGEVLHRGTGRDYTFVYRDEWRFGANAFPLSLSMPLAQAEAPSGAVLPFLWGLLPDDGQVLARWAQRYSVSAGNPVGLLAHVGEDCAGAAQFVPPERAEALLAAQQSATVARVDDASVRWLDEREVAERLRDVLRDPATTRLPGDTGQFSLAGAQPKTALLWWQGRWGVPSGRVPTTHILKPPALEHELHIDGLVENEHCCLALVGALGLNAAVSRVLRFDDQAAIVVLRYDRFVRGDHILRIHQEDACQALSVDPANKYENEGGPGAADVAALLRTWSTRPDVDLRRFLRMLGLNWIIAGTDAHAKNYGLLLGARGEVRLAPFYDVVSALPYPKRMPIQKIKLAMRVGREYLLQRVGARHWRELADTVLADGGPEALGGWDADALLDELVALCARVPDEAAAVRRAAAADGLDVSIVTRWADAIAARAALCGRQLRAGATGPGGG